MYYGVPLVLLIALPAVVCSSHAVVADYLRTLEEVPESFLQARTVTQSYHVDRRRSHDTAPPCESTNPTDAGDSDCYVRRFTLIQQYYPKHVLLRQLQRMVVQNEAVLEDRSDKILWQIGNLSQILHGTSGGRDGLLHDANEVLTPAVLALASAGDVMFEKWLVPETVQMREFARTDTGRLKEGMQKGADLLLNQTEGKLELQKLSAYGNTNYLNKIATAALRDDARDLTDKARGVAKLLMRDVEAQIGVERKFGKDMKRLVADNDKDGVSVDRFGQTFENDIMNAETVMTGDLTDAVQNARTNALAIIEARLSNPLKQLGPAIDNANRAAVSEALGAFTTERASVVEAAENAANLQSVAIDSDLVDSVKQKLADNEALVSDGIFNAATDMQRIERNNRRVTYDTAVAASKLSQRISKGTGANREIVQALLSQINAEVVGIREKSTTALVRHADVSGELFERLIEALGQSRSDAFEKRANIESNSVHSVSDLLESVGKEGTGMVGSVAQLQRLIKALVDVRGAKSRQVSDELGRNDTRTADAWERQVSEVVAALGDSAATLGAGTQSIEEDVDSLTREGGFVLGHVIRGVVGDTQDNVRRIQRIESDHQGEVVSKISTSEGVLRNMLTGLTGDSLGQFGRVLSELGESSRDSVAGASVLLADSDNAVRDQITSGFRQSVSAGVHVINPLEDIASRVRTSVDSTEAELGENADDHKRAMVGVNAQVDQVSQRVVGMESILNALPVDGWATDGITSKLPSDTRAIAEFNTSASQLVSLVDEVRPVLDSHLQTVADSVENATDRIPIASQQDRVDSTRMKLERLKSIMSNFGSNGDATGNFLLAALTGGVLDPLETDTASAATNVSALAQIFRAATYGMEKELASINYDGFAVNISNLLSGALQGVDNEYEIDASDFADRLVLLKEQLATASSAEDRNRIISEMVVLERLLALTQRVSDVQAGLFGDYSANTAAGIEEVLGLRANASVLMQELKRMLVGRDQSGVSVGGEVEAFGEDTVILVNGLHKYVDQTESGVRGVMGESVCNDTFGVAVESGKADQRSKKAMREVGKVFAGIERASDSVFSEVNTTSELLRALQHSSSLGTEGVARLAASILNSVEDNAAKLELGANESMFGVSTQIGLVRTTTAQFLRLWDDYASNVVRRLALFGVDDVHQIQAEESAAVANITTLLHQLGDVRDALESGFKLQVENATHAFNEFRSDTDRALLSLGRSLTSLHQRKNNASTSMDDWVGDTLDLSSNSTQETTEIIQTILANFEDAISPG